MAQDAKGQVGGLECEEGARRRLARESAGWRCAACGGRRNAELLSEESQGASEARNVNVEVPTELRLGYRDEMAMRSKEKAERSVGGQAGSTAAAAAAAAAEGRSTSTMTMSTTTRRGHGVTNNVGPDTAWIDKAIMALLACLAVMIGKKILHL